MLQVQNATGKHKVGMNLKQSSGVSVRFVVGGHKDLAASYTGACSGLKTAGQTKALPFQSFGLVQVAI